MKKIIGIVLFCGLVAATLLPAAAMAMWARTFGTMWNDMGSVWPLPSGGYHVYLTSEDYSTGMGHSYLSNLDPNGVPQWTKKIYITDFDQFVAVPVNENEFFIGGTTRAAKDDPDDIVWSKFLVNQSTGELTPLFRKRFGGSGSERGGFGPTADGGYLFTGSTDSYGSGEGDKDILLIKIDSSGSVQWSKVFYREGAYVSAAAIREITGGYMMTASTWDPSSILVAKLNASGEPQWVNLYGPGDQTSVAASIHPLSGGQYLLLGSRTRPGGYLYAEDLIAIKLDHSGSIIWAREYEAPGANLTQGLLYESADGTLIISSNLQDAATFRMSPVVITLDSDGNVVWARKFSGGGSDVGSFARNDDGTYYLSATSDSFAGSGQGQDILYGKADADFNILWARTFGGPGFEAGSFWEHEGKKFITAMSNSWGAGGMDVLAVTLDVDGGFPDCKYCKEVSLMYETQGLNVTSLNWTSQETSLSQRMPGSAQDTTVNVVDGSITASDTICYAAPVDMPEISVTPTSLNFGGQTVGGSSEMKVTVKNVGTADLVISSVSSPAAPFGIVSGKDKCSGKTLKPLGECEITFRFAPVTAGAATGSSAIASNDPERPVVTVDLSGTGMEPTCVYSFTLTKKENIPYRGMTVNFVVKGTGDKVCPQPPPLESNRSWITTYPFTSWRNNQGSVKIKVMPNSDSWEYRTGVVTIGQSQDNKLAVGQQGTPCKLGNLVPASASFKSAGALNQAVAVSVTPGDCSWTALTADPWVNLVVGVGPGPGNVVYDVLPNDYKKARVGKITVYLDNSSKAKKVFTIRQAK